MERQLGRGRPMMARPGPVRLARPVPARLSMKSHSPLDGDEDVETGCECRPHRAEWEWKSCLSCCMEASRPNPVGRQLPAVIAGQRRRAEQAWCRQRQHPTVSAAAAAASACQQAVQYVGGRLTLLSPNCHSLSDKATATPLLTVCTRAWPPPPALKFALAAPTSPLLRPTTSFTTIMSDVGKPVSHA